MTQSFSSFPYIHSGEPGLPGFLQMRAEGVPLRQSLWNGLSYLRKWRHPKLTAPPEELQYFDHQRELLRRLVDVDSVAGSEHGCEGPGDSCVRLAMVGDLMWLRSSWESFLSKEVLDYLNSYDVVLGNMESPISSHHPVPDLLPDYFTYNSKPSLVTSFRRPNGGNTFSALATCNNHCLDCGDQGLLDTLDFLDGQGIRHAGARRTTIDQPFATWQAGDITLGFYASCWGVNDPSRLATSKLNVEVLPGIAPRVRHPVDLSGVQQALNDMSCAGVEFKIVYLHWGYEFEFYPCPDLMQVGREIVRAGADLVIGSHPHVVQPLEICFVNGAESQYRGRWQELPALTEGTGCILEDPSGVPRKALIAYSLGNFASVMFTLHCQIGLVLGLELERNSFGRVEWSRPRLKLVYNVPQYGVDRSHRLVLLDEYLRSRELEGKRDARLRAMQAYLSEHLLGKERV